MSKQLVLAEKPSVARDYARILNCKTKGEGCFEGPDHVVTWSFGHLCTLKEPDDYTDTWKSWKLETLPMIPAFELKLNGDKGARDQFKCIKTLVHRSDVTEIVIGTDAGREGEAIARWILTLAGNKKPMVRLWVSTMTDADLRKGFTSLKPASAYDSLYDAAFARAKQDWLIGMNFTRLMTLTRATGKQVLSVGRVQTPVLSYVVTRDLEIEAFQADPFYEVLATFDRGYKGKWVDDKNESKIIETSIAEQIVARVNGKPGQIANVKTELKSKPAPQLFDLTALQRQMNRRFGFSAKKTLDLTQTLYEEHKILSYPRTNSRYLSDSMKLDLPKIVRRLNFGPFTSLVEPLLNRARANSNIAADWFSNERRFINNAEVTDHHAIIPTDTNMEAQYARLTSEQRLVFDEVALTFLAQFYTDYLYNSTTVHTQVEDDLFLSRGVEEVQLGWRTLFQTDPDAEQDAVGGDLDGDKGKKGKTSVRKKKSSSDSDAADTQKLPPLTTWDPVVVVDAELLSKKTKPPARLTEDSILAWMEKYGLGTPATRAGILETLIGRNFIQRQKKQLISSDIGKQFISLIDDRLKSVEQTAEMEAALEAIMKNQRSEVDVMDQMIERLRAEMARLKSEVIALPRHARLGKSPDGKSSEVDDPSATTTRVQREIIGVCPVCAQSSIVETDKAFGCMRFREGCQFTIWKTMAGETVPRQAAMELITAGRTSIKLGFISKAGKPFEAFLMVKDGKVAFDFGG